MKFTLLFTESRSWLRLFLISKKHHFDSVMFCKSINSDRARLARVSVRLWLVWLEYRLGLDSFFSENESLGIKNQQSRLGIKSSASLTSLVETMYADNNTCMSKEVTPHWSVSGHSYWLRTLMLTWNTH